MRTRCVLLSLVAITACVRTTPVAPQEAPPPKPVVVPDGCLDSLAGRWVHERDPSYEYDATDDGGTLTLVLLHHPTVDAGFSPRRFRRDAGLASDGGADAGEVDAGPSDPVRSVHVELTRTSEGFVGSTLAPVTHPSGRTCEARFPTAVVSCADGGLRLETDTATALGDSCQAPASPQVVPRQQHGLIRPPDAG